jgi:hypothetical protein
MSYLYQVKTIVVDNTGVIVDNGESSLGRRSVPWRGCILKIEAAVGRRSFSGALSASGADSAAGARAGSPRPN